MNDLARRLAAQQDAELPVGSDLAPDASPQQPALQRSASLSPSDARRKPPSRGAPALAEGMTAPELADRLRSDPRAQVLEKEDLDALARLIEDPATQQVAIAPPVGKAVIKGVGVGFLKIDINLREVTNTDSGVACRLTGGITVAVGLDNGRVVLDLPSRYARLGSAADGYIEQINEAFADGGRRIASIHMNEDSLLEIKTEPLSTPTSGIGD